MRPRHPAEENIVAKAFRVSTVFASMRPRHPAEENRSRCFPCPYRDLRPPLRALGHSARFSARRQPSRGAEHQKNTIFFNSLQICERSPGLASPPQRSQSGGELAAMLAISQTIIGSTATAWKVFPKLITRGLTTSDGPRSITSTWSSPWWIN